jgi:hypothetical protein
MGARCGHPIASLAELAYELISNTYVVGVPSSEKKGGCTGGGFCSIITTSTDLIQIAGCFINTS